MSCDCWGHAGHCGGISPSSALLEAGLGDPAGRWGRALPAHPFATAHGHFEEMPRNSFEWLSLDSF